MMADFQQKQEKTWWAPVWTGLVMDAEAKHYRRMKNAVWLFLYLLLNANRRTGVLRRKIKTIGSDMGVSRDTACRWLNVLRRDRYIVTLNTGHSLTIQIKNWKPITGVGNIRQPALDFPNSRSRKYPTPVRYENSRIPVHFVPKTADLAGAKERKINILNNERGKEIGHAGTDRDFTSIDLCAKQEILALDLSKALDDPGGIALYRAYSQIYSERLLREVLAKTLQSPSSHLVNKKGRSTLFNFLIQQYVPRTITHPGH